MHEGRSILFLFFFFQAEDGIRDLIVTGVQTCALPILDDPPVVRRGRARIVPSLLFRVYDHRYHPLLMASAPEASSSISFVMRPCLALFAATVRSSRRSDALSVAFRIATIRADCSEAALSSAAW